VGGFEAGYAEGSLLWIVNNIYFQYYSLLIFVVSVLVLIAVSYATEPPAEEQLAGLTFATVSAEERRVSRASWNQWDVINSAAVMALIVIAYLYFRG
jgi:SSS family solute:Na+ symporter